MKLKFHMTVAASVAVMAMAATGLAQTWTRVASNGPPNAGLPMLLTDGTVLVHSISSSDWWKLTPNKAGSYVNGTWKKVASMPSNYAPLYFASGVLKDGRVVVIGGEYNFGASAWTNLGAWYDPAKDKWTALSAPSGWNNVGDAQASVMPDGRFFLAMPFDTRMASLDPSTMTWSSLSNTGKADRNDEEGWTLMPDGTILTTDAEASPGSERYIPSLGKWISAGTIPVTLVDAGSEELGPVSLMPTGKVVAIGAIGHNAQYTPGTNLLDTGSWSALPDLPSNGGQLGIADGCSCVLPNGNILLGASPGVFASPTYFYEWNGTSFNAVPGTPNSGGNSCFQGNMLLLPTGQVMYTDFSSDVEIYTPTGTANAAWKPKITATPSILTVGKSATVKGTQFNGLTQGSYYGDDNTNATNYPIAQITYTKSGNVAYFKTHDHSTMAVATGSAIVSTVIDTPLTAELGTAKLRIIANGIASDPVDVTISKDALKPDSIGMFEGSGSMGSLASVLSSDNSYFTVNSITQRGYGEIASAFTTFTVSGSVSFLQFSFETSVLPISTQLIYFAYNWNTGQYDALGNAAQAISDKVTEVTVTGASKYVSSAGKVKFLLRAVNPTRSNRVAAKIQLRVDQVSLVPG